MKRRELLIGSAAGAGLTLLPTASHRPFRTGWTMRTGLTPNQEPNPGESNSQQNSRQTVRVKSVDELVTDETRLAINAGLEFLKRRQVTSSGSLQGAFGSSQYAAGVAVAALGGLAFLCNGSTPIAGRYSSNVRLCTNYLCRHTNERGYISNPLNQASNMYGHGYGMLFLSQVYGMSPNHAVREKLQRAVDMTCEVQNDNGGWRYQPHKQPGDLSVTICQIMGLRASHDAGLSVSEKVREKTLDYVRRSQLPDGSFQYMLRGGRSSVALTAAGVVSLYSAGVYEGEIVDKALKWLMDHVPGSSLGANVSAMNYYYAHYYAVQAMWHAQLKKPAYWNTWYPAIRDELLKRRRSSSHWNDNQIGPEFATAMACIILQIPFNYVPVFAP